MASPAPVRTLVLMRHAEAANKFPGMTDLERPLTKRGREDAAEMGRRLAALPFVPGRIVASHAARTLETGAIVAKHWGPRAGGVQRDEGLYLAGPESLREIVAAMPAGITALLLIGHNPGISEALSDWAGRPVVGMPAAAFAVLNFTAGSWEAAAGGTGDLQAFEFPGNRPVSP